MDLLTLTPLPVRISPDFCKRDVMGSPDGVGVAVCQDLGLLVISCSRELQVFALPADIALGNLAHVRTLGGVAPMEFDFCDPAVTGFMAFTDGGGALVTDAGHDTVHVIDVVHGSHVGYVAAPGVIAKPRGVAARKSLAAVSSHSDFVVRVFMGSGSAWTEVRVIRDQPSWVPSGLRFTADGMHLVVADLYDNRLSIFRAEDGAFVRDIVIAPTWYCIFLVDIEECEGGGRWIVSSGSGSLLEVPEEDTTNADGDGHVTVRRRGLSFIPFALAVVPGLGLVVRHSEGVQFLATPDAVAMATMSLCKVAWMAAVCRGRV